MKQFLFVIAALVATTAHADSFANYQCLSVDEFGDIESEFEQSKLNFSVDLKNSANSRLTKLDGYQIVRLEKFAASRSGSLTLTFQVKHRRKKQYAEFELKKSHLNAESGKRFKLGVFTSDDEGSVNSDGLYFSCEMM